MVQKSREPPSRDHSIVVKQDDILALPSGGNTDVVRLRESEILSGLDNFEPRFGLGHSVEGSDDIPIRTIIDHNHFKCGVSSRVPNALEAKPRVLDIAPTHDDDCRAAEEVMDPQLEGRVTGLPCVCASEFPSGPHCVGARLLKGQINLTDELIL